MKSNLTKEDVKMIFGICHFVEVEQYHALCKDKYARNLSDNLEEIDCEKCKELIKTKKHGNNFTHNE